MSFKVRPVTGKCIMRNCENARKLRKKHGEEEQRYGKVTYHRFPKDQLRRKKWAHALRLPIEKITDHHRVCSDHFVQNDFDKSLPLRVRLRESAVPFVSEIPGIVSDP